MKTLKLIMVLGLGAMVSACTSVDTGSDAATRNASFEPHTPEFIHALPSVRVDEINVLVPTSLKVSEKNSYLPSGDIVWRGDAPGDRHQQVREIFDSAIALGTSDLEGTVPVRIEVRVDRFHALTEKARYVTGGIHNIHFVLQMRNISTGEIIGEPRLVHADLKAFGGRDALAADARGETQKVRITEHLSKVIHQELTSDDGFTNPKLGFIQALNKI